MKSSRKLALIYLVLFLYLSYVIAPYCWLCIQSFIPYEHLSTSPPHFMPETSINYLRLFGFVRPAGAYAGNIPAGVQYVSRSFINSLVVSGLSTIIAIILASFAAYTFARIKFPGSNKILTLTIALRMLPVTSVIIPIYLMMNFLHLIDSLIALIIMYTAMLLPYDILMLTTFFQSIPSDLDDSARVDGCNRLQALLKVTMPLASPGLVAVGIFNFLVCWNEFFIALILTRSEASYTVPVVISMFTNVPQMMPYDYMITAGVISSIPPLILSLIFSKYLMKGLIAGAIK